MMVVISVTLKVNQSAVRLGLEGEHRNDERHHHHQKQEYGERRYEQEISELLALGHRGLAGRSV